MSAVAAPAATDLLQRELPRAVAAEFSPEAPPVFLPYQARWVEDGPFATSGAHRAANAPRVLQRPATSASWMKTCRAAAGSTGPKGTRRRGMIVTAPSRTRSHAAT